MESEHADSRWLDAAAALCERAIPASLPNPPVGAILVRDGIVVGRGWTQPGGRPHAEAVALQQAGELAAGATLYVTLEPCAHRGTRGPACADLASAAGLARVVVGVGDPDPRTAGEGAARLRNAGAEVAILDHEASGEKLAPYLVRRQLARPFVTLKLAVSADGFIAPLSGEPVTITGPIARAHVHRERARCDAILVGGATLRGDMPRLDVRLPGLEDRSPQRFVLSAEPAPDGWTRVAAPSAIAALTDLQHIYVEGGGKTAEAFMLAGLVDRLMLYRAPRELGAGIPGFGGIGPAMEGLLADTWRCIDTRRLGEDSLSVYRPLFNKPANQSRNLGA